MEYSFSQLISQMGIVNLSWQQLGMILLAFLLLYWAVKKEMEPLLLVPIAFGILLANLPLTGITASPETEGAVGGLLYYLQAGTVIYPPLIFLGIGSMTDFSPLIADPKTLLLGAAAQFGIFAAFLGALWLGFTPAEAGSIGIIGGADGPTAIYLSSHLTPHLLGPIAIAAYLYIALVPLIQPPIIRLFTTSRERGIKMEQLRRVSKRERLLFPLLVVIVVAMIVPSAVTLVGMLMLGNFFRECRYTSRLARVSSNALVNIVTIFLMLSIGSSLSGEQFFTLEFLRILFLGLFAFAMGTFVGLMLGKVMSGLSGGRINPIIGAAGVSVVPTAARLSQRLGREANPETNLLMHAMGPNVAGVIGSAVAAGVLLTLLG